MCVYKVLIMHNTCTVSVRNIYNLFVRGLESDRKRSPWQCLAARARTCIFTNNVLVLITPCNVQNNCQIL